MGLADQYANAPVDTQVSPGHYSAFHWSQKAQAATTGTLVYMGTWDASSGAYPASPAKGHFYKVTTAGTYGGYAYSMGDQIIYNGTDWDIVDNSDQVTTVAGKSGAVVLVKADVGLGNVDNTSDANKPISTATQAALNGKQNALGYTPVNKAGDTMTGPLIAPSFRSTSNSFYGGGEYFVAAPDSGSGKNKALIFRPDGDGSTVGQFVVNNGGYSWGGWNGWHAGNFNPDSKANLNSPIFTGTPRVSGSGSFQIDDGGSNSVRYGWNADMSVNGSAYYKIWHAGNFNPDLKASLAGANYFTDPNPIIMSKGGNQVNQFNVGDRTGWYDVAGNKYIWFYTFATKSLTLNGDVTANGSLTANSLQITGLSAGFFSNGTGVQYNGQLYLGLRPNVINAAANGWVTNPRIFVQAGDPGAGAADGDLWVW